jgi:hypothetical protein
MRRSCSLASRSGISLPLGTVARCPPTYCRFLRPASIDILRPQNKTHRRLSPNQLCGHPSPRDTESERQRGIVPTQQRSAGAQQNSSVAIWPGHCGAQRASAPQTGRFQRSLVEARCKTSRSCPCQQRTIICMPAIQIQPRRASRVSCEKPLDLHQLRRSTPIAFP